MYVRCVTCVPSTITCENVRYYAMYASSFVPFSGLYYLQPFWVFWHWHENPTWFVIMSLSSFRPSSSLALLSLLSLPSLTPLLLLTPLSLLHFFLATLLACYQFAFYPIPDRHWLPLLLWHLAFPPFMGIWAYPRYLSYENTHPFSFLFRQYAILLVLFGALLNPTLFFQVNYTARS